MPERPLNIDLIRQPSGTQPLPQPPGALTPSEEEGFSLFETAFNIPGSAFGVVKDIARAVVSPVETGKALGRVGAGAVQKLIPGRQKQEKDIEAVASFFSERFGIKEFASGDFRGGGRKLARTIEQDPVGFLLDISGVLTAGGAAAKVARVPQIVKAGQIVAKAGAITDPFSLAGRLTRAGYEATGKLGAPTLGLTTGAGAEAIRQAYRNPTPEFTKAMRGVVEETDVLGQARDALSELRSQRRQNYQSRLEDLKLQQMDLNIDSVNTKFESKLNSFGVKTLTDKNGIEYLDFSRSKLRLDSTGQSDLNEIKKMLDDWGSSPGDRTPLMVDTLKQNLDELYSESSNVRAVVADLRNETRTILDKVPGYAEMSKDYRDLTNVITDIEKTLSLKTTVSNDTAIKKLTSVLRENQEYRKEVLKRLETYGDKNLVQQVAGIALRNGVPRGLVAKLFIGGEGLLFFGISPVVLMLLPVSSPRLVGEFVRGLGLTAKQADNSVKFLDKYKLTSPEIRQSIFQASRARPESDQKPERQLPELPTQP